MFSVYNSFTLVHPGPGALSTISFNLDNNPYEVSIIASLREVTFLELYATRGLIEACLTLQALSSQKPLLLYSWNLFFILEIYSIQGILRR